MLVRYVICAYSQICQCKETIRVHFLSTLDRLHKHFESDLKHQAVHCSVDEFACMVTGMTENLIRIDCRWPSMTSLET